MRTPSGRVFTSCLISVLLFGALSSGRYASPRDSPSTVEADRERTTNPASAARSRLLDGRALLVAFTVDHLPDAFDLLQSVRHLQGLIGLGRAHRLPSYGVDQVAAIYVL